MPLVYLNGEFFEDASKARVSAFDAGLQHAVGLFETMLGVGPREAGGDPRIHRLAEHLVRLADSVEQLGLAQTFHAEPLADLLIEALRRWGMTGPESRARVRLTVTGGDLNLLSSGHAAAHRPTIMIVVQEPTPYPAEMFERGVGVVLADVRLNPLDPFEGHKTLNFWRRLSAMQAAAARGAAEALFFQVTNHLAGGAVSNAFVVKGGRLLTPIARGEETERAGGGAALASPVLPGITRLAMIENASEMGIEVEKRMLTIDDVLTADEVFLTNSSFGVLPVVRVERNQIGTGEPGEVTKRLRNAWLAEMR